MRTKDATWHLQRVTYIAWLVAFLAWMVVEPRPKPTCQSRILPTGNKVTHRILTADIVIRLLGL